METGPDAPERVLRREAVGEVPTWLPPGRFAVANPFPDREAVAPHPPRPPGHPHEVEEAMRVGTFDSWEYSS